MIGIERSWRPPSAPPGSETVAVLSPPGSPAAKAPFTRPPVPCVRHAASRIRAPGTGPERKVDHGGHPLHTGEPIPSPHVTYLVDAPASPSPLAANLAG